ncbi:MULTISPECIES: hypothetical protein [Aequorivita]|uniref:Lipoprotein n=1 Tax=Aequorivita iocasae TaxID=2803865 RepID=A0ABX7DV42_9FLAO|nr:MULTISPECIES: hypothetical protein [Aequorivita]QQX77506.1 hypothetical protein JK629_04335 [Aequorivita iocasae]UCA56999.1 hypothetical protein LDL78_04355 [Aequorivita sp. F7]
MRRILFLLLIFMISCNSNENTKNQKETILLNKTKKFEYNLFDYKSEFELVISEFYLNHQAVGNAVGYNLFIGKTSNPLLPENLSVLSFSEENIKLSLGDTIRFIPNKKQHNEISGYPLIYYSKDSMIDGKMENYILGSENKAIWADPISD